MANKWIAGLAVFIILGGAAFWYGSGASPSSSADNTQATTSDQDATAGVDKAGNYTLNQLAQHNTANDCWMAISGKVYDVTDFIAQHPGGEAILLGCGTDATSLFTQRQTATGEKVGSGTPHSSYAATLLEDYFIGRLTD